MSRRVTRAERERLDRIDAMARAIAANGNHVRYASAEEEGASIYRIAAAYERGREAWLDEDADERAGRHCA